MKKQIKWWMIPLGFLSVILVASVLLWPTLRIYLAPKTVLTAALTDTCAELELRFAGSPLILLGSTLDLESGNTIDMSLDTSNDLLGSVRYDMAVQVQWKPRRILARGQASAQRKNIDLSVYLDGDFAALSSAGILQENYYGLTFDTFAEDISSNKLISFAFDDATLNQWTDQIRDLEAFMEDSWEFPSVSMENIHNILMGIFALKAQVDREDIMLSGVKQTCYVISFETNGAQIAAGLDYLNTELPISLRADDEVDIYFWMVDDSVVKIDVSSDDMDLELYLGKDPLDDITLQYINADGPMTVTVSTQPDDENYQETIQIIGTESTTVSYNWNLTTGDLALTFNRAGEVRSADFNLSPTENGFRVITEDFESLMHVLLGIKDSADSHCVMTVSGGSEFGTPEYKNFSEWSLEDLVTLLSGVGGLFGLNIG